MGILKWTYIPPLLIYASAGISGLTNIVGMFFLKDYLNLSAAFIASIGFWAGIPWALKMPVGFIVDKCWKYKNFLVYLGASIIFLSLLIMYFLLTDRVYMENYLKAESWFILSALLTPVGYVIQDVVADAMTVEAVEVNSSKIPENKNNFDIKKEHTLIQMYGRFAIILGSLLVSLINILIFRGIDTENEILVLQAYASIYLLSLTIPLISISGVFISSILGKSSEIFIHNRKFNSLDYKIFFGSLLFVSIALILGGLKVKFSQEIVLSTSLLLIAILMHFLTKTLSKKEKYTIVGTAFIIFIYRAMPTPGPGINWFKIKVSFVQILNMLN